MSKKLRKAIRATFEDLGDDPIIIGAPQTLVTVKDTLGAIVEDNGILADKEADKEEDATKDLEKAADSLEAIANGIRVQIRDGGMTPQIAATQAAAVKLVLSKIGMESSEYVISHESFSQDPLNVSLEAERVVKEALAVVNTKLSALRVAQ